MGPFLSCLAFLWQKWQSLVAQGPLPQSLETVNFGSQARSGALPGDLEWFPADLAYTQGQLAAEAAPGQSLHLADSACISLGTGILTGDIEVEKADLVRK